MVKVQANSFGRVAENRSKLEARAKGCYHECLSVGVNYHIIRRNGNKAPCWLVLFISRESTRSNETVSYRCCLASCVLSGAEWHQFRFIWSFFTKFIQNTCLLCLRTCYIRQQRVSPQYSNQPDEAQKNTRKMVYCQMVFLLRAKNVLIIVLMQSWHFRIEETTANLGLFLKNTTKPHEKCIRLACLCLSAYP